MSTPSGWYPDSENPGGQRYWDGSQWAEHRAPASALIAPVAAVQQTPGGMGVGSKIAIVAALAFFALIAVAAIVAIAGGGSKSTAAPTPTISSSSSPTSSGTSSSPSASPTNAKLASKSLRDHSAALMLALTAKYRSEFNRAQTLAENKESSEFVTDRLKTGLETDTSFLAVASEAQKGYAADNEPPSISTWLDDVSAIDGDANAWYSAAVDWRGGFGERSAMDSAAQKLRGNLARADKDAQAVAEGN